MEDERGTRTCNGDLPGLYNQEQALKRESNPSPENMSYAVQNSTPRTSPSSTPQLTPHITLPHRLNKEPLCFYKPIPIHVIPVETLNSFSPSARPTTIDSCFEIWDPPTVKEEFDPIDECPDACEVLCCYTPKTSDQQPVGMIRCRHPDVMDKYIEYYVCKWCYGLHHRFCGMEIVEQRKLERSSLQTEETEQKDGDQTAKPWGPCWDENSWEKNWWADTAEWAKWHNEDGSARTTMASV
ncbi:hypothetical protein Moror_2171 [Moniliophthora roreri MCA 2997]|uniref:Uncharacterized protein n=2 Tax=Moniliophthora roreri TaxID=221103 RepID=V2WQ17_MONRO|nr:hypothetical protein Moror_2171 [Moniliophthora roreri MCA 2997]